MSERKGSLQLVSNLSSKLCGSLSY